MDKQNIPWAEKYRPNNFDDIILDKYNKQLFQNILNNNKFPNLLLHGPPGIGKTTTIINLINNYQKKYNQKSKTLIIHLNASDERGIDIIRNNIYNFVNTKNLFFEGTKFVILDEVDYMTRIAQLALKSLMQEYNCNIKYCLICNYISKIETSLKNEFIKVRFNKLKYDDVSSYLNTIIYNEKINISSKNIDNIINYFDDDIRSMINFIQSNLYNKINILDNKILKSLFVININDSLIKFNKQLNIIEDKYKTNKFFILKCYLLYIITNNIEIIDSNFLNYIEFIIHNINNSDICINYIYFYILDFFKKSM